MRRVCPSDGSPRKAGGGPSNGGPTPAAESGGPALSALHWSMRFRGGAAGFRLCEPVRVRVGADVVLTFRNAWASAAAGLSTRVLIVVASARPTRTPSAPRSARYSVSDEVCDSGRHEERGERLTLICRG